VATLEDMTGCGRLEAERRKHREQLVDLVRQRMEELVNARDDVRDANKAKSVFLANISHPALVTSAIRRASELARALGATLSRNADSLSFTAILKALDPLRDRAAQEAPV